MTGCPAVSVPAGFTPEGWPVGLQIVAAPRRSVACSRWRTPSSGSPGSATAGPTCRATTSRRRHEDQTMSSDRRIRIGIDTGGTFTDVVAVDEETGELAATKTPSTPHDPAEGFMSGVHKVLGMLGLAGRLGQRGLPRHHGRHQQAARGQGREPRLHHHRGLRVHARDRPAVGARRLRQLLLLGEAGPDRPGAPGQDGRRPAVGDRRADPPLRRGLGDPRGAAGSATRASTPSASASCTPTPTTSTSGRCSPSSSASTPRRWCRSPARCCASTASTNGPSPPWSTRR